MNCPYRLYKNKKFTEYFMKIPHYTFAPNVILSGIACKDEISISEVSVKFSPRSTGEVSIQTWKLLEVAAKSWWQCVLFWINIRLGRLT